MPSRSAAFADLEVCAGQRLAELTQRDVGGDGILSVMVKHNVHGYVRKDGVEVRPHSRKHRGSGVPEEAGLAVCDVAAEAAAVAAQPATGDGSVAAIPTVHVEIGADGPVGDLPDDVAWDGATVKLSRAEPGHLKVSGDGYGNVYRAGAGHGDAVREGSGDGGALRVGAGDGDAVRDGSGGGGVLRDGTGDGDAVRDGSGWGLAARIGDGNGDAVRDGAGEGAAWRRNNGHGDAVRRGDGNGEAWRDGAGNGDAHREGDGTGSAVRDGDGTGTAYNHGRTFEETPKLADINGSSEKNPGRTQLDANDEWAASIGLLPRAMLPRAAR